MKYILSLYIFFLFSLLSCGTTPENVGPVIEFNIQPTIYPLLTVTPELTVWAESPVLYTSALKWQKGEDFPLTGIIRVDGKAYRFLGNGKLPDKAVAPVASDGKWEALYTFVNPVEKWHEPDYDDTNWIKGEAPFGTPFYYEQVNTIWPSPNLWVRRKIAIEPEALFNKKLYLSYSYDDSVELYVNGIQVVKTDSHWRLDQKIELPVSVTESFREQQEIVIAAYTHNEEGGAFLDFGLYVEDDPTLPQINKYTFTEPSPDWQSDEYGAVGWESGNMPFGTPIDYTINTPWHTQDIWLRSEIVLSLEEIEKTLLLRYSHDDIFELSVNGVQLLKTGFEWNFNQLIEIPDSVKKAGKLLITAHCINKVGGALVDYHVYVNEVTRQKSVVVSPTQTYYEFECGPVDLTVNFISPRLLEDMESLSYPLNYITYEVTSTDDRNHVVEIYFETEAGFHTTFPTAGNATEIYTKDNLLFVKTGKKEQKVFSQQRDVPVRDWGYFYLCSDPHSSKAMQGEAREMRKLFMEQGVIPENKLSASHLALVHSLGETKSAKGKVLVGHDEGQAIQYLGENLYPYWHREYIDIERLLIKAATEAPSLIGKVQAYEEKQNRVTFSPVFYRQLTACHKLVEGKEGELLLFSQGNVQDIIHSAYMLLPYNVDLAKKLLKPVLDYSLSSKWQKFSPPLALGESPLLNGQMSVEETSGELTADLLILMADIAAKDKDTDFVLAYWSLLTQWYTCLCKDYMQDQQLFQQVLIENSFSGPEVVFVKAQTAYEYMARMVQR